METPQFACLIPNIDPDSPFQMNSPTPPITNRPRKSGKDRPSPRGLLCFPTSLGSDLENEEAVVLTHRRKKHRTETESFVSPDSNDMNTASALLLMRSPTKKGSIEPTHLDIKQDFVQQNFTPLNLNNDDVRPSGRKSPLVKHLTCQPEDSTSALLTPFRMLLLDYEELRDQGKTALVDDISATDSKDEIVQLSPVCKELRSYAAETKYANEYIVTNMERVYTVLKETSEPQLISPDNNHEATNDMNILYTVSVPDSFLALPSEIPSQSFCHLKIEKNYNPANKEIYTRLTHTVGIDICDKTGVIYKNPDDPIPRSIQIVKRSDAVVGLQSGFEKVYEQQLGKFQASFNSSNNRL